MRVIAINRFTADLTLTLEAAPGWYALASHFVSTETGQHTARVEYKPFEVAAV